MLQDFGIAASGYADHVRSARLLADLCGLEPGRTTEACGQTWCAYFDRETTRCALLAFDIPARIGPIATEWFVRHRGPDVEALAARTSCL